MKVILTFKWPSPLEEAPSVSYLLYLHLPFQEFISLPPNW